MQEQAGLGSGCHPPSLEEQVSCEACLCPQPQASPAPLLAGSFKSSPQQCSVVICIVIYRIPERYLMEMKLVSPTENVHIKMTFRETPVPVSNGISPAFIPNWRGKLVFSGWEITWWQFKECLTWWSDCNNEKLDKEASMKDVKDLEVLPIKRLNFFDKYPKHLTIPDFWL